MSVYALSELSWDKVRRLGRDKLAAILPVGSLEAHGPHLPLSTDTIISNEMAKRTAEKLSQKGFNALILPAVEYTIAEFAKNFDGSFTIGKELFISLLKNIGENLNRMKIKYLIVANSHLDPNHLSALHESFDPMNEPKAIFVDKTKRKYVEHLTEEFRSGSCHAGEYETSLVMAVAPELIGGNYAKLGPKFVNLAEAIKSGSKSFEEVGMDEAYCGDPSKATAEEGIRTYDILSDLIVNEFLEAYND